MHLNLNLQTTSNMIAPLKTSPHIQSKSQRPFSGLKAYLILPIVLTFLSFSPTAVPLLSWSSHKTSLLLFQLTKHTFI